MLKSENNYGLDGQSHDLSPIIFDEEWAKSQENPIIKGLNAGELFRDILEKSPGFKKSFKSGEILDTLECSDGRVNDSTAIINDEKLGLAGSGILFNPQELEEFVLKNYGRIKTVTSHEECGAAALKYSAMLKSGEAMPEGVHNSDELAQHFARRAAELLGAEYRHIKKEEFSCPVHNERLVVIDGTAKFNPNKIKDFPPRYISAALGLGVKVDYVAKEAEVLAKISLGSHGFGSKFTANNPFYIIMFAKDQQQLKDVGDALTHFFISSRGRIKIIGIVAPEESAN